MGSAALGGLAVLAAVASFGSFGVPIRSRRLQDAQVHPIVVQCYKTAACFMTCWLALLLAPFRFTWWGTVGAAIWVLNGIAAIVAIQSAGLAVSQALWSGLSVFVSFVWGAAVFRERVASLPLALAGLCIMAAGMAAVGTISARGAAAASANPRRPHRLGGKASPQPVEALGVADIDSETRRLVGDQLSSAPLRTEAVELSGSGHGGAIASACDRPLPGAAGAPTAVPAAEEAAAPAKRPVTYGAGIVCAVYVGIANGSFLVPLKYANRSVTGLEYLVSFGVGAALVTGGVVATYSATAPRLQWQPLQPKWRAAAPPALLAGLLWSAGNVASILATQELGLALAWPAVQAQLLVSTAWGAIYFGEVRGRAPFVGLLAGSGAVVAGVAALAAAKG